MPDIQRVPQQRFGGGQESERRLGLAIRRGLGCTCPHCGSGKLFRAFLKPVDHCAVCGEDYSHQRSDDLPPYIVIVIVGHVLLTGFMLTDMEFNLSPWTHLAIWSPIAIIVSLAIIQPVKGGVIGLQWALRMHGFSGEDDRPEGDADRF
ncbi:DUF983 domain-containing protein [Allorhizobium undicola]|uniref:DUF983 domain-containing protein n=1 Tax=Allorhizobium undicola TaxID=78527 RepID=UPI0004872381|nr:DUF983 domain-containing protein [Allorhizobium undicola]